jgi:hypothetical protein
LDQIVEDCAQLAKQAAELRAELRQAAGHDEED